MFLLYNKTASDSLKMKNLTIQKVPTGVLYLLNCYQTADYHRDDGFIVMMKHTMHNQGGFGMNTLKNETEKMFCNGCGKTIMIKNGIAREGVASIELDWGYFSEKDGEHHSFCLCESCYDKLVKTFAVPVKIHEKSELI